MINKINKFKTDKDLIGTRVQNIVDTESKEITLLGRKIFVRVIKYRSGRYQSNCSFSDKTEFRKRMLREIMDENKGLLEENKRLQSLLN